MEKLIISSVVSINEPPISKSEDQTVELREKGVKSVVENGNCSPHNNLSLDPAATKLVEELQQAQRDKNEAMEDRDSLFKILERRSLEVERLENDVKTLKSQLKAAVESKNEALTNFDQIQHKTKQIEFKERLFEQDRAVMETQIETLTSDLNRNIQELQQARKESTTRTLTLEAKLHEKSEELAISSRQSTQLKEANSSLVTQVEELSQKLLKFNEDYSNSMHKYQQELKSKTRLSELYREKNEDVISEQKDVAKVVSELRSALKEATDDFGNLETTFKQKQIQYEQEREEMVKLIGNLQSELKDAYKENIETSIEKLISSNASKRLSGKSITEIFTLYVQCTDDLESLNIEHQQLKQNYNEIVKEIKEKGPIIQKTSIELERLKNAHETLRVKNEILHRERLEAHSEAEVLVNEIQELRKSLVDATKDRKDLSRQICYMLEKGSRRESCDFVTFDGIEELQDNNIKLVALVRDLSAAIEKLESEQAEAAAFKRRSSIQTLPKSTQTNECHPPSDDVKAELIEIKQQFESYRKKNEKTNQQLDQFHEVSSLNFKLKAQVEHQEGQLKLQQKNVEMYKQKIQNTEDRLQSLIASNAKMETILTNLNAEMRNADTELRNLRRKNESLCHQNQNFLRTESRLRAESEVFQRQNQLQGHMMNNLEFIKASLERSENESRAKMEEKFEEVNSECLRLKSQMEVDRSQFREFEEKANEALAEKDDEATQLHNALTKAYEDLEKLTVEKKDEATQYEENIEIIESEAPGTFDNIVAENIEIDDCEVTCNSKKRPRDDDDEDEVEIVDEKRLKVLESDVVSASNEITTKCVYHVW